jgi:hypothetical protein
MLENRYGMDTHAPIEAIILQRPRMTPELFAYLNYPAVQRALFFFGKPEPLMPEYDEALLRQHLDKVIPEAIVAHHRLGPADLLTHELFIDCNVARIARELTLEHGARIPGPVMGRAIELQYQFYSEETTMQAFPRVGLQGGRTSGLDWCLALADAFDAFVGEDVATTWQRALPSETLPFWPERAPKIVVNNCSEVSARGFMRVPLEGVEEIIFVGEPGLAADAFFDRNDLPLTKVGRWDEAPYHEAKLWLERGRGFAFSHHAPLTRRSAPFTTQPTH